MPIPVLLLIFGGIAAIGGGAAAVSGSSKIQEAKELYELARKRYDRAVQRQKKTIESMNERASALGSYKAHLVNTALPPAMKLLKGQYPFACRGAGSMIRADSIIPALDDRLNRQLSIMEAAGIGIKAVGAGSAAGSGACALVGLLGTASTGTAIASLTGAAAQSATMAWFGGGALAAGGAGIAGGALALGGLVVTPAALLAGGIATSVKAEKIHTDAVARSAGLRREQARIASSCRLIRAVDMRIVEIHDCLTILEGRLQASVSTLSARRTLKDMLCGKRSKNARITADLVRAILEVIEAPIFDQEQGRVSVESERVLFTCANTREDEA